MHDKLYKLAEQAIDSLMADTSVSPEETMISLNTLCDHLNLLIEAMESGQF